VKDEAFLDALLAFAAVAVAIILIAAIVVIL